MTGDAAHRQMILDSDGANLAIEDGIDLADHIAKHEMAQFSDFIDVKHTRSRESQ